MTRNMLDSFAGYQGDDDDDDELVYQTNFNPKLCTFHNGTSHEIIICYTLTTLRVGFFL